MRKFLFVSIAIISILILGWILKVIFAGTVVLPQVFHLGSLAIHFYGLVLGIAILSGYWVASGLLKRQNVSTEHADKFILYTIIGGVIGARIYHVFSSFGYYSSHPLEIPQFWLGGLSIYGAVLGGIAGLWIAWKYIVPRSFSFFSLLDWLVPATLVGQIIGRFGNFFNYELFGYPTELPWKMFVPGQFRGNDFSSFAYFHPLFLYEALFNGVVLVIILWLYKKKYSFWSRPGTLFFTYILLYNVGRFFLEFLRIDSVFIGNLRQNAIVSAVLVILAGILLARFGLRRLSQVRGIT